MKHLALKTLLAVIALTLSATAKAERLFSELAGTTGVESVYVGKSMLGMARGMLGASGSKDARIAGNAVKNMESIEIISCEVPSEIQKVKTAARKIISRLKLDVMVETREDDEQVTVYGLPSKKNPAEMSDMIIETMEPGEYTIVHISGSIDVNSLIGEHKNGKK